MKINNFWKKFVSVFLVVALMCPLFVTPAAAAEGTRLGDIELSGIRMTPEEFERVYVTDGLQCVNPSDYTSATLSLKNISNCDSVLSMSASINDAATTVSFDLEGLLFNGFKQDAFGISSYVLDATVSDNAIKPLLFEIVVGSGDTNAIVYDFVNDRSSIKCYFTYGGFVYLFEGTLPTSIGQIDFSGLQTMTAPEKDLMWFIGVVDPVITIEDTATPMSQNNVQDTQWMGDMYRVTMHMNGKEYLQVAVPFGYVSYDDSISTANHTWKCGFFLSVHTTYNGTQIDVESIIRFTNVSIGIKCGINTEIVNVLADGNMAYQTGKDFSGALDLLSSVSSTAGTFISALEFFNDLRQYGALQDIDLGGSSVTVLGSRTNEAAVSIPDDVMLRNSSFDADGFLNTTTKPPAQYYLVDATVRAVSSASNTTRGTVYFKWDALNWSTLEQLATDATADVLFTYSTK